MPKLSRGLASPFEPRLRDIGKLLHDLLRDIWVALSVQGAGVHVGCASADAKQGTTLERTRNPMFHIIDLVEDHFLSVRTKGDDDRVALAPMTHAALDLRAAVRAALCGGRGAVGGEGARERPTGELARAAGVVSAEALARLAAADAAAAALLRGPGREAEHPSDVQGLRDLVLPWSKLQPRAVVEGPAVGLRHAAQGALLDAQAGHLGAQELLVGGHAPAAVGGVLDITEEGLHDVGTDFLSEKDGDLDLLPQAARRHGRLHGGSGVVVMGVVVVVAVAVVAVAVAVVAVAVAVVAVAVVAVVVA